MRPSVQQQQRKGAGQSSHPGRRGNGKSVNPDANGKRAKRLHDGLVHVRGAREHNLKNIDVQMPRDALVVFTGVSGSGKSSLAFGTLYAEAQRRYLESVNPYARRLFHQMSPPQVDEIDGLPPAVALQQQRGTPTTRSSVGSVTDAVEPAAACSIRARGIIRLGSRFCMRSRSRRTRRRGRARRVTGWGGSTTSPKIDGAGRHQDDRERAIAAWPSAWQGQNLRDIITTLGIDIDKPWRELPKKTRQWLLFTTSSRRFPFTPAGTWTKSAGRSSARKSRATWGRSRARRNT
jgi:excinuclease ABC subunit A